MAWLPILDKNAAPIGWEYDDAVATAGVRTNPRGVLIYAKCRPVGSTKDDHGEINKTYWDSHDKVTVQSWP